MATNLKEGHPLLAPTPLDDPALVPFLEKSPTLNEAIRRLSHGGIRVEWGPAGKGTYTGEKRIVIDEDARGHGEIIAQDIAHEYGHYQFGTRADTSSRQAYVNHFLRSEANATLSNAAVRLEVLARVGPDIGINGVNANAYAKIADQYFAKEISSEAARDGIARIFGNEHPSNAPEKIYSGYYGEFYETHVKPGLHKSGQHSPATGVSPAPVDVEQATPDDPAHRDHALLQQIRAGVRHVHGNEGHRDDDQSERMSRSLLAACKEDREHYPQMGNLGFNEITRADHVLVGGGNMFVVQGRPGDPAALRAHVDIAQALMTPVEHSDAKVNAAQLIMSQERVLAQQQEQASHQRSDVSMLPTR